MYQLIKESTKLKFGDKIRRPMGEEGYDYLTIGEYIPNDDIYEINLPNKHRIMDAISVLAYISKKNMIAQNYEVLS